MAFAQAFCQDFLVARLSHLFTFNIRKSLKERNSCSFFLFEIGTRHLLKTVWVSGGQVEKAHNADLHCVDWNPHDDNLILTGYLLLHWFSMLQRFKVSVKTDTFRLYFLGFGSANKKLLFAHCNDA